MTLTHYNFYAACTAAVSQTRVLSSQPNGSGEHSPYIDEEHQFRGFRPVHLRCWGRCGRGVLYRRWGPGPDPRNFFLHILIEHLVHSWLGNGRFFIIIVIHAYSACFFTSLEIFSSSWIPNSRNSSRPIDLYTYTRHVWLQVFVDFPFSSIFCHIYQLKNF